MIKAIFNGNLTNEPEMKSTTTGKQVCTFTVAVHISKDESEFLRVSAWGKTGEFVNSFLSKGDSVLVCGTLKKNERDYKGKHYVDLDVTADSVEAIKTKPKSAATSKDEFSDIFADALPF